MRRMDRHIAARFALAATLFGAVLVAAVQLLPRPAAIPATWLPYLVLPAALFAAALFTLERTARRGEWMAAALAGRAPLRLYASLPAVALLGWITCAAAAEPVQRGFDGTRDAYGMRTGAHLTYAGPGVLVSGIDRGGTLEHCVVHRAGAAPRHLGSTVIRAVGGARELELVGERGTVRVELAPARALRSVRRAFLGVRPLFGWAVPLHVVHLLLTVLLPLQLAWLANRTGLHTGSRSALAIAGLASAATGWLVAVVALALAM